MSRRQGSSAQPSPLDALCSPRSGKFERVFPARPLAVPLIVEIRADQLSWRTPEAGEGSSCLVKPSTEEERRAAVGSPTFRTPREGMLAAFLDLRCSSDRKQLPDESIGAFARKWGPLGICEHGLPHTHWPLTNWDIHATRILARPPGAREAGAQPARWVPAGAIPCYKLIPLAAQIPGGLDAIAGVGADDGISIEFGRQFCQPLGTVKEHGRGGHEPLSAWRVFSSDAYLILRTASALHAGKGWTKLSRAEARQLLYGPLAPLDQHGDAEAMTDVNWRWVQSALHRWLGYGNVRPTLQVGRDGVVTVTLGTAESLTEQDMYLNSDQDGFFFDATCGLFGALAAQMLLVVQNRGGFEFCAECQAYFEPPGRRPREGERHYCSPECRRKRSKYAARDYRLRKK